MTDGTSPPPTLREADRGLGPLSMQERAGLLGGDHRMVAEGIAGLGRSRFDVLPIVEDGEALVEAALRDCLDVILSDIAMPRLGGVGALRRLTVAGCSAPVIILTMHAEPAVEEEALDAGARGYVLKSAAGDELLRAIDGLLTSGLRSREIAERLDISVRTGPPAGPPQGA